MVARSTRSLLRPGLALLALVALSLAGCAAPGDGADEPTSSSTTAAPSSPTPTPTTAPESETKPSTMEESTTMEIVIELDGRSIQGRLDDNAASASLLAQLPLTLSFSDFGGQEKIATLPQPLDLEGAPQGSAASALTIGYYSPNQGLVLYYEDVGHFSGIVPLGTFQDAGPLTSQSDDFTATVRLDG